MQKRNNYVSERPSEDDTIRVNEKTKDDSGLNVRACLTAEEYSKFGERFPEKFRRVGLLGRGGFSVVWLAVHRSTKRKVAVKQILTKNPHETHLKEIWFGSYFFEKGGEPRE
jgi:dual specificity tyrosine-phosphorylation-regulated kinase 2/3/4